MSSSRFTSLSGFVKAVPIPTEGIQVQAPRIVGSTSLGNPVESYESMDSSDIPDSPAADFSNETVDNYIPDSSKSLQEIISDAEISDDSAHHFFGMSPSPSTHSVALQHMNTRSNARNQAAGESSSVAVTLKKLTPSASASASTSRAASSNNDKQNPTISSRRRRSRNQGLKEPKNVTKSTGANESKPKQFSVKKTLDR